LAICAYAGGVHADAGSIPVASSKFQEPAQSNKTGGWFFYAYRFFTGRNSRNGEGSTRVKLMLSIFHDSHRRHVYGHCNRDSGFHDLHCNMIHHHGLRYKTDADNTRKRLPTGSNRRAKFF